MEAQESDEIFEAVAVRNRELAALWRAEIETPTDLAWAVDHYIHDRNTEISDTEFLLWVREKCEELGRRAQD